MTATMTRTLAFERITEWTPAFDKRSKEPSKNCGIHGAECRWVLKGEKGAIQFLISTNWQLPHVAKEFAFKLADSHDIDLDLRCFWRPMPADLGYHSPVQRYESQTPIEGCPWLDGKPCYYDGSGLQAEYVFQALIAEGSEAVWKIMEERYREIFEEDAK